MSALAHRPGLFAHVLCAVDGSEESVAAELQAAELVDPDGVFELVVAAETFRASSAGWLSKLAAEQIDTEARAALARGEELVPGATPHFVHGHSGDVILRTADDVGATLVAVGARRPRLGERLLGTVADEIVRRASCSVLVARRRAESTPRRVVCGVDGSPQSLRAAAVAAELGRRFACPVELVAGLGGKGVVPDKLAPSVRLDERPPVDALVDAALEADLVVVGNRGLHGLHALGSVSTRVAARCDCSVLVLRSP